MTGKDKKIWKYETDKKKSRVEKYVGIDHIKRWRRSENSNIQCRDENGKVRVNMARNIEK